MYNMKNSPYSFIKYVRIFLSNYRFRSFARTSIKKENQLIIFLQKVLRFLYYIYFQNTLGLSEMFFKKVQMEYRQLWFEHYQLIYVFKHSIHKYTY